MRRTSACCRKVEAKLRQRQLKPQPCLSGCIRRPSQHSGDSQPRKSTCGQELSAPAAPLNTSVRGQEMMTHGALGA